MSLPGGGQHPDDMLKFSVVIQAGGKSSRMGQDKALLPFRGTTMLEYILRQIEGLGEETLIITNTPQAYQPFGLPLFGDVIPDWGALGGLYSAIYHASHPYCLVLACDMPFINRPFLEHLVSLAPKHDAVVPRLGAGRFIEPFRAVYSKTCLQPIRAAIEAGHRKVISFFEQVDVRFVERVEIEPFDPQCRTFFNVNTPGDLAQAERMAADIPKDG